jgi:hypothetical protein
MGIVYQEVNKLDCHDLEINNKLVSKNVTINDQDNHLVVYDNSGKKIFWINDDGCSIKAQDKVIELDDVIGFPKLQDGLLCVSANNLDFVTDISLGKLQAKNIDVDMLAVKNLEIKNITLPSIDADSIINKILTTDKITSAEADIKLLNNHTLVSNDISSNHINTYSLNVEVFEPIDVSACNIKTNKVEAEEGLIKEFQSAHAGIVILESKHVMANELKIIDLANIKLLNCEEANIEYLNVVDASFITLYADKIRQPKAFFGSLEEPMKLNMVDCPQLDCNNEQGIIHITNEIRNSTPQNKIQLINIPDQDYSITTICHNQFINVNYNICKVNDATYLYTKFNEVVKDLVVEIIMKPI